MDRGDLNSQFLQGLETRHSLAEKHEEIARYQSDLEELDAKISTLQRYRTSIIEILAYINREIGELEQAPQKP